MLQTYRPIIYDVSLCGHVVDDLQCTIVIGYCRKYGNMNHVASANFKPRNKYYRYYYSITNIITVLQIEVNLVFVAKFVYEF